MQNRDISLISDRRNPLHLDMPIVSEQALDFAHELIAAQISIIRLRSTVMPTRLALAARTSFQHCGQYKNAKNCAGDTKRRRDVRIIGEERRPGDGGIRLHARLHGRVSPLNAPLVRIAHTRPMEKNGYRLGYPDLSNGGWGDD